MNVNKNINQNDIQINIEGRLDTTTAPILENEISDIENYKNIVFDLKNLEYISSAGLRVLLTAQKRINKINGSMKIINTNPIVKEVFEVTGFVDIITIE